MSEKMMQVRHYMVKLKLFGDVVVCRSLVMDNVEEENLGDLDILTKQILELIFGGFAVVSKRLLYDHLEGGKYFGKEEVYEEVAKSVPSTNAQSE